MLTYQALSTPNRIIKSHYARNLALAVTAAVAITVILTSGILSVTQANAPNQNIDPYPGPHTQHVISGALVLNPHGYYLTGFYVPDNAQNPVLQGNYAVIQNSTNNNVVVTIWNQQEFTNWINCKSASPCYNKDLFPMVSGDINVTLSSGQYLILISGASVNTEVLQAQIDLNYTV